MYHPLFFALTCIGLVSAARLPLIELPSQIELSTLHPQETGWILFSRTWFLINVVAQTLPTMVHDYIQYLINVVAIQIMSTSWRGGLS